MKIIPQIPPSVVDMYGVGAQGGGVEAADGGEDEAPAKTAPPPVKIKEPLSPETISYLQAVQEKGAQDSRTIYPDDPEFRDALINSPKALESLLEGMAYGEDAVTMPPHLQFDREARWEWANGDGAMLQAAAQITQHKRAEIYESAKAEGLPSIEIYDKLKAFDDKLPTAYWDALKGGTQLPDVGKSAKKKEQAEEEEHKNLLYYLLDAEKGREHIAQKRRDDMAEKEKEHIERERVSSVVPKAGLIV